jgi:hypothetical protein
MKLLLLGIITTVTGCGRGNRQGRIGDGCLNGDSNDTANRIWARGIILSIKTPVKLIEQIEQGYFDGFRG